MSTTRIFSTFAILFLFSLTVAAQPPGRGDGDRGSRGGPPGGGFGPPGGGFGPPGGGFGPPGGGFRGGGGPPGGGFGGRGSRGGPGGSRGGFDPSSFLSRLDANGNGMIDPEEQQGPAQFIIGRLQQNDPSIRPGRPIPLSKITEGFQQMREQRDGGRDDGRGRSSNDDDLLTAELLVPGFGIDLQPDPLMGFGPAAEMLSVAVTEEDEREANELLQRMDRNRDGVLSGSEISSRFSGNPLDFDRNRDGKLTARELAVRYARRREGREEARRDDGRRRDDRGRDEPVEIPDVFNGRKSYRVTTSRQLPEGLPGFFTDKDADRDGQVSMAEFAEEWSDEVLKEFFASDLNRDGVITADEALRAVEMPGVSEFASTASSSSPAPSPGGGTAAAAPSGPIDEKYLKVGQRIVGKYDKNNDAALTASEWEKMLMSPADADANRDGKVTVEEYALWMQSRDQK